MVSQMTVSFPNEGRPWVVTSGKIVRRSLRLEAKCLCLVYPISSSRGVRLFGRCRAWRCSSRRSSVWNGPELSTPGSPSGTLTATKPIFAPSASGNGSHVQDRPPYGNLDLARKFQEPFWAWWADLQPERHVEGPEDDFTDLKCRWLPSPNSSAGGR